MVASGALAGSWPTARRVSAERACRWWPTSLPCVAAAVAGFRNTDQYGVDTIWYLRHTCGVDVDGPEEFFDWLDRTEAKAKGGDVHARRLLGRAADALNQLRELDGPPTADTPDLKRVRQSKTFPVWRTAHPFDPEVAFRLICWFPPGSSTVVVETHEENDE